MSTNPNVPIPGCIVIKVDNMENLKKALKPAVNEAVAGFKEGSLESMLAEIKRSKGYTP